MKTAQENAGEVSEDEILKEVMSAIGEK